MHEILATRPVIPVIEIDNPDDAEPLANALLAGGIDVIEITFRTAAGADAIERIRKSVPDMIVGAGTVVTGEQAKRAIDLGVAFGVAPGLNETTLDLFSSAKVPFLPGVATASEVERGLAHGCTALKFFPAAAAGGPAMLKALSGPYASHGVTFCPTGGINLQNMNDYLSLPIVSSIGGSWIASRSNVSQKQWDVIETQAAEALTQHKTIASVG